MKTKFNSSIPTETECEILGNKSKDYREEQYQESICLSVSFEKVFLERLIYETTLYSRREIYDINVTEKIYHTINL